MFVGACLADQPLPSSTLSSTTTTSPLHLVNLKVVEAGDDFCASTLPLLQVNLFSDSNIMVPSISGAIFNIRSACHTLVFIIGPFIILDLKSCC